LAASWAVRAGPRSTIYFNPASVKAAIVTVGGLCPGLNDVIRAIVDGLESYGVPQGNIYGVRYGLRGFHSMDDPPIILTGASVENIHLFGGTILGTSRGGSDIPRIADSIASMALSMLYVIGGNGGHAAAAALDRECATRGYACAIVGLPKSVDNDLLLVDRCFGFDTAVAEATAAILAASVEAHSCYRGIGLVKLMGRESGFIAAEASIASGVVDVCVIPEAEVVLSALLPYIHNRLLQRGHAVVVVAEGAFQDEIRAELAANGEDVPEALDASGNKVLLDVGGWLRDKLKEYSTSVSGGAVHADVKLISPSYSASIVIHLLRGAAAI
jgi:6-phosphofructokinase 1